MKSSLGLFLLCLLSQAAIGQPQLGRIYHLANPDGSIAIVGENHGFAPYTVYLSAELVNMHSTQPLPAKFAIYPSQEPRLLTTLIADRQPYSFKYKYPYQLGIYTSRAPDTSYVYSLPFKLPAGEALPPCSTDTTTVPGNRYPYFFSLPAGTAVCAARVGIVYTIRQDVAKTKGAKANYLIVFHEDGGVAWYQNLEKNAASVKIGQRVAEGDTLGYVSSEKQHPPLYFDVEYPGEEHPQAVPVTFRVGDQLFRPHRKRTSKPPAPH
ncbi:MAG: M23 family metallopeptidase [Hymenobacter sp.]|nr:MAG: M23 family metallopeptidase [Hymenobacter sp.]